MQKIYWGWFVVAGAFLLMALTYGARYSYGIFVQPLTAENGWSRSVVSLAASINLLVYAAGGILSGRLLDRVSPRWIATAGAAACAAGFFWCAGAASPLQFFLAYGVLYGFGSSWAGTVTATSSVGKWFVRRRGIAIGISSMGVSFGTITFTPAIAFVLERFHWKTGFVLMGLALLIPGVLIAQLLLYRRLPEDYGLAPDGDRPAAGQRAEETPAARETAAAPARSLRGDGRFRVLALCHGTAVMTALMAFVHQVPYAVDNGVDPMAAAASLAALGFAGLLGQFFFGWVSDRIGDPKYAASLGYAFMAAGTLILLKARSVETLMAYALVFGFGYGCLGPLLPIIAADRFGRLRMGAIFGLLTFFVVGVGGSLGPAIGGIVYDATGSYLAAWWLNIGLLVAAALGIATLRRRPAELASADSRFKKTG
ncbi:MAG: MFS transporter [Desulfobacterales bacterium]